MWININSAAGHVRIKKSGNFHELPESSAQAELWAVLNGIWLAKQEGAHKILAQSDCLDVVERSGPIACIEHFEDLKIDFKHVKGHTKGETTREWVNNWCDKMAKKKMRRQRRDAIT